MLRVYKGGGQPFAPARRSDPSNARQWEFFFVSSRALRHPHKLFSSVGFATVQLV